MSGDSILIAANCWVPLTMFDMAMATKMLRRMPFFVSLNRLCELDEYKHAPEDEDNIWMCGIFKVPNDQLAIFMATLGALPYLQTLCLPEAKDVSNNKMSLRYHPRLSGKKDEGKSKEHEENDSSDGEAARAGDQDAGDEPSGSGNSVEGVQGGDENRKRNREAIVIDADEDDTVRTPPSAEHMDETMITEDNVRQVDQPAADETVEDVVDHAPRPRMQAKAKAALDKSLANTRAGRWQLEPSPPPPRLLYHIASLGGEWKEFTGRGGIATHYPMPSEASFTPLDVISFQRHSPEEFFTNIFGQVARIYPLDKKDELYWRIELFEPFKKGGWCAIYMFQAYELDVGTVLEGLKEGDWLIAFNVHIPGDRVFANVRDSSVVFVAEDPTQASVVKKRTRSAP